MALELMDVTGGSIATAPEALVARPKNKVGVTWKKHTPERVCLCRARTGSIKRIDR